MITLQNYSAATIYKVDFSIDVAGTVFAGNRAARDVLGGWEPLTDGRR